MTSIKYMPGSKFWCEGCKRQLLGQGYLYSGNQGKTTIQLCTKHYKMLFPKFEEEKTK